MPFVRYLGCASVICAMTVGTLTAQSPLPMGDKLANAVRVEGGAIRLDGRLDEEVWSRATAISDFTQKEPVEGAAPSERTEVRFAYDEGALYVGARMLHSGGRTAIQAPLGRRDAGALAEFVLISLDTYLDRRTAYSFGVTAAGVRLDHHHRSDSEGDVDRGYNPVWDARVAIDDEGWTAEMWIPFSQLRFDEIDDKVWGLNVHRWVPSKNEDIYWSLVPRTQQGWASRFGELRGIGPVRVTRRIELLPYVLGGSSVNGRRDLANPFDDGRNLETQIGADLKVGLGSNLTLDATFFPDFGQVEVDPAVINLSATETFYAERRPFFTEGVGLIGGGITNYFYSRRIGAPPLRVAAADFTDYPRSAPILGAAKLTGRLPSGLSLGLLAAVTGEAEARTYDVSEDSFDRVAVAPRTGWGVARVQQEVGSQGSTVSLMAAAVRRDLESGEPLAELLTRNAITLAGESVWRLMGGRYQVGVSGGMSHVDGDSAAILRVQRAPPRYFQRRDAPHLTLDPSRTSLTGYKATIDARKLAGAHWLWDIFLDLETPGVEFNDIGRISFADGLQATGTLTYRETAPGTYLRNYRFSLTPMLEWTTGRERRWTRLTGSTALTWNNFWSTNLSTEVAFRAYEWPLTRGGPLMETPLQVSSTLRLQNSASAQTRWNLTTQVARDELDGWLTRLEGGLSIVPGPRWQLSLTPSVTREVDPRQYVTARSGGRESTFGNRYIFAAIDRTTVAVQARVNFTFRPGVDLDLFAQPFAGSGHYSAFGELAAPRSRDLLAYGSGGTSIERTEGGYLVQDGADSFTLADRDFNVRSFRSTSVLRWEWRPGSTLFLVWQQSRSGDQDPETRASLADMLGSVGEIGNNYFAIKVSYWLGG